MRSSKKAHASAIALIVDAGAELDQYEIEQETGFQVADLIVEVGAKILLQRRDRLLARVFG